jgi:DNA-binding response OmpR family regulator
MKLIFDKKNSKILGAQAFGRNGVDKRIDVIAVAIHGNLKVEDLTELDLAYAPPYSSANDPINMISFVAQNSITGFSPTITPKEAIEKIKEIRPDIPVIAQTANAFSEDRIFAINAGFDDYISKPISPKVLVSRINALLRRTQPDNTDKKPIKVGNMTIDQSRFVISIGDQEITLAKKEFELLWLLAGKPGRVFLRNEILNTVWGTEVIVGDRTIDVHIRKIRQKLGIDCIKTVKGVGYKFEW